VRALLAAWLLGLVAILSSAPGTAADAAPGAPAADAPVGPAKPGFAVQMLSAGAPAPTVESLTSGSLDSYFEPFKLRDARKAGKPFWLRLQAKGAFTAPAGVGSALIVRKGRHLNVEVWPASPASGNSSSASADVESTALPLAATKPTFGAAHDAIFVLPNPSGRNAHFSIRQMRAAFVALRRHLNDGERARGTAGRSRPAEPPGRSQSGGRSPCHPPAPSVIHLPR